MQGWGAAVEFLIPHGLTASVCLGKDGQTSAEGMGEKSKAESSEGSAPLPFFPTRCRMGGECDNFQVTLSPCTVTRLPTELGSGSLGKADYQAKNTDLNLCMQDSYQAPASSPFYLLPLFLHRNTPWLLLPGWFDGPAQSRSPLFALTVAGAGRGCSPQTQGSTASIFCEASEEPMTCTKAD